MPVFYLIFIIIFYSVIFSKQKKSGRSNSNRSSQNEAQRTAPSQPQPRPQATVRSAGQRYQQAPVRNHQNHDNSGFDSQHFHKDGYDFATCFSFKDVPPGCDELAALMEANGIHEKRLEKMLQTRD